MLSRALNLIRFLVVVAYVFLARRNLCPCMIARQIALLISRVTIAVAATGGFVCRQFDRLIDASDNLCGPECQGCGAVA